MIYLYILLSLVKSSIVISLHKESNFSPENHPFTFRGLSFSSSMTNYYNYQYYIQACIGTPPQCFSMLLSLKSPWIFIDQKNCTQCRSWPKKFDNSTSSTYKGENKYSIFESVDSFEGYTGYDTVNIAGIDAKSQGIVLVSKENEKSSLQSDGVFGLGFNTSKDETVSIISTLYSQGSIEHMVFSIYINDFNSASDFPNYGDSVLIIDGHDIDKYAAESNFTYIIAKNSDGFWQVDFDNATFDGINITSGHKAIISPGTSFILGSKDAITQILKRLHDKYSCENDGNGLLYCNCYENYPDLIIQLAGIKFRIKSAGYLIKTDNGYCILAFGSTTITNTWTLGDAFLRRFYTFYDMENMKIGFATIGNTSEITFSTPGNSSEPSPEDPDPIPNDPEPGNSNNTSSSSSDINWKIPVAVILSVIALPILIVWIYLCGYAYSDIRKHSQVDDEEQRYMNRQKRLDELKNEINGAKAELERLKVQKGENNKEIAEQENTKLMLRHKNNAAKDENKRLEKLNRRNNEEIGEQENTKLVLRRQNDDANAEKKKLEELNRINNDLIVNQERILQGLNAQNNEANAEKKRLEDQKHKIKRKIAELKRIKQERRRKNNEQEKNEQEQIQRNNEAIANQQRIEQELKINNENAAAELKRLEEEKLMLENEIAEKRRWEAELGSSSSSYANISNISEANPYPAPQVFQKCWICERNFDEKNLNGLQCGHYFCEEELRDFIEVNIRDNNLERAVRCPYRHCPRQIGSMIIQSLISQNSWRRLNDYAIENNLLLNNEE